MARALASVQRVVAVEPIPGADAIEVATVRGWKVVIKKGEYAPGDLAVYCEIDAFLPVRSAYEFLRPSSYKRLPDGTEGFRLRTVKLRGQVSQGLLLPLATLPEAVRATAHEGLDVTDALGVILYEPPLPPELAGLARGPFPSFLVRTEEERVQNLPDLFERPPTGPLYATEKLDGSSVTFYVHEGTFGVCSRGLDLIETPESAYWAAARALGVEAKLRSLGRSFALQGELVGPGVQKNPYRLGALGVYVFDAFDVGLRARLGLDDLLALADRLGLALVPILDRDLRLPPTLDDLLRLADGPSALRAAARREGLVVRSHDRTLSFKVISNRFLLAEE